MISTALGALAISGSAFADPPIRVEIAPGVVALVTNRGAGITTVEEVRITPERSVGESPPELAPLLEAALDWCSGRIPNGFEQQAYGMVTDHGCRIALDGGVYAIRRTAVLRPPKDNLLITIDLGSAVIVHAPDAPRTLKVADMAHTACGPANLGDYYQVENPESFDDFRNADPEGEIAIESAKPNDLRSAGCPDGTTVCKYGANALRIVTKTRHGLSDGGPLDLGDVIVVSAPKSAYDGERLLVKEVLDANSFIVTLDSAPTESLRTGSIRETATTVWCNGNRWRAGKPMIAVGGPGSAIKSRLAISGGKFLVDGNLFRTAAILVDGDAGPDGRSGAEWISIDTTHGGNGSLRGQIVVDMGTDDPQRSKCQNISVRVDSDSWGHSWGPSVWNRSCDTSDITVRQGHGGGVWIGLDAPSYAGPTGVALRGSIQGCYDGPCLWVRSGVVNLADGIRILGSMWGPQGRADPMWTGPQGSTGPARGLVAILGTQRSSLVNVTAHGAIWGAAQDSDLDCYVRMGGLAAFVQIGGQVTSGNSERGFGRESLFCDTPLVKVDDFVLEHVQRRSWGGTSQLVEMSPLNQRHLRRAAQ